MNDVVFAGIEGERKRREGGLDLEGLWPFVYVFFQLPCSIFRFCYEFSYLFCSFVRDSARGLLLFEWRFGGFLNERAFRQDL